MNDIVLTDVKVVRPRSQADTGSVLKIVVSGQPVVGIRFNLQAANGIAKALTILSGANAGKFVTDANLYDRPGINLSGMIDFTVDPSPFSWPSTLEPGMVFHSRENGGSFFMRISALEGHGDGFVSLGGAVELGTFRQNVNIDHLTGIAKSIALRKRD